MPATVSRENQLASASALVKRPRFTVVRGGKNRFHGHRVKAIWALAELAGDRHGPLLLKNIANFIRPERTQ